jgi:hypothetical protein
VNCNAEHLFALKTISAKREKRISSASVTYSTTPSVCNVAKLKKSDIRKNNPGLILVQIINSSSATMIID